MKVYLLAAALSLAPAAAFAQFASGFSFMSYSFDARDAGAAAAIAAANHAIQQCMQKLRGRSVDTVCTTQTPEPAKTK